MSAADSTETAAALAHSSAIGGALDEKSAALDSLHLDAAQTAARLAAAGAQMRRGDTQREVRVRGWVVDEWVWMGVATWDMVIWGLSALMCDFFSAAWKPNSAQI